MATFMMALAVVTWIGGIISGIVMGVQLESFWVFLGIACGAAIEGALFAAVSLMLSSLKRLEDHAISIKKSLKLLSEKPETPPENSAAPTDTRKHYRVEPTSNNTTQEEKEPEQQIEPQNTAAVEYRKQNQHIDPSKISCPKCYTLQPCNRVRCYNCGAPLLSESIPYVCGKCGHPGPYDGACPECGSTMKAY